jgi:hypothetical protein
MPRLTKRVIEAAETKAAEHFIWDDSLPGFGVRVLPSGRKGIVTLLNPSRKTAPRGIFSRRRCCCTPRAHRRCAKRPKRGS